MQRLTLYATNGTFLLCLGTIPEKFSENFIIAGDWKCKITESNCIVCTSIKHFHKRSRKIVINVSVDGLVELSVTDYNCNSDKTTHHFKKKFDVYSSVIAITLDTNIRNIKVYY